MASTNGHQQNQPVQHQTTKGQNPQNHQKSVEEAPSPLLQNLNLGNAAINNCLNHDKNWPELGDILTQGSSNEYSWQVSPAWKPFFRSEVVKIPDAIFEQYNSTECFTQMGLFAEIQRAWITVDNRLYLWNYANGQDFQAYEDHPHTITCVRLVSPRPGVFVDAINYLLVVATPHEIFLLGIASPKGNAGEMQFYGTRMSVPTTGIDVSSIEPTSTGRLFFTGKIDTHVYELQYQAEEGWFSRRCSKVNHTGSAMDNFMPNALASKSTEHIVQITIDNTRKVLYTLSSNSSIRAYTISEPAALTHNVTYTYRQAISHAQMINANLSLLDPTKSSIVAITAITMNESKQIYLLATTSSGCRLYMRSSNTSFYNPQAGAMSSLQVSHVRFPPSEPESSSSASKSSTSLVSGNQNQASAAMTLSGTINASLFASALFLAVKREGGSNPHDSVFSSAPELNRIAQQFSSGNTRPLLTETCCWVPIEGFVQDICPVGATATMSGIGSELTTQFTTQPATFAVLTNTGVHIIRRRRTIEIMASVLRHSPSTAGGIEGEMRRFFENIGRAEGCATCLGVICGSIDGSDVDSEALSSLSGAYGSTLSAVEVLDTSRKYFIEFGGKAFVDENQNRSFAPDGSVKAPTLDTVRLSGRHDGIALYVSRLLATFWKLPFNKQVRGPPGRGIDYVSNLPTKTLTSVQARLVALQQFLETNKNFIEGLNGPDRLLTATSKTEEIILQAEHRGMHALMVLVTQIIEALSFIQVLSDSPEQNMTSVISSLSPQLQTETSKMTFETLTTTTRGREIAKELITNIVNRRIAQGGNVESVSETLQKRCGSFCSADDVILYKAIEKLKRAKESGTVGERNNLLQECLQLFLHASATLTNDNLKDTIEEFTSMQFYSGALQLAFAVARADDPYDVALAYLAEGKPADDSRAAIFAKREQCYSMVFTALDKLEQAFAAQEAAYVGTPNSSPLQGIRDSAYQVITDSQDQLFHNLFYDWYVSRGLQDRLLEIQSPFIRSYLERKATQSTNFADLLWQYLARNSLFLEAAQVLYHLAGSTFQIGLDPRMEYLSQGRNFCSCVPATQHGPRVTSLYQNISEELDVASIQDDVLNEIRNDQRLNPQKRQELVEKLDGKLLPLTELFNNYADPLSYHVICLSIFQAADYRGTLEIRNCWEKLIDDEHEKALALEGPAPYEAIAQVVQSLGRRFQSYEIVFPIDSLLPMLQKYSITKQRSVAGRGWVTDALVAAGTPLDIMFHVLDGMFELPTWQSTAQATHLISESLYLIRIWLDTSLRPTSSKSYAEFQPDQVLAALSRYGSRLKQNGPAHSDLRIELETLKKRIQSSY